MIRKLVKINSMAEADIFNKICSKFECDMDLVKGKYYIDAKSIMGIFSLNLDTPVELVADTDDEKKIQKAFRDFLV